MAHSTQAELGRCELLAGLRRGPTRRLLAGSETFIVPAGGLILVEGDPSNDAYLLLHGALAVETRRTHLAYLAAGDHFGEVGVLTGRARSATVEAIETSKVLRIDGTRFRAAFRRSGSFRAAVEDEVARRSVTVPEDRHLSACEAPRHRRPLAGLVPDSG
jgi:CPA1 family monovalent cation:H+ antiporter